MDRLLDTYRNSPRYPHTPNIAQCVADAIQQGKLANYTLHSWVAMPNHVHLLITPHVDVSKVLQQMKGASVRIANSLLGLEGKPFWQNESYDHFVRNSVEFRRIENYIIQNPVKAGLVQDAGEYRWSSAYRGVGLKSSAS